MFKIEKISELIEIFDLDMLELFALVTFYYDADYVLFDPVENKVHNHNMTKTLFLDTFKRTDSAL